MSALEKLGLEDIKLASQETYTDSQEQTKDIFGFKWSKRDTYETEAFNKASYDWLIQKYFKGDPANIDKLLGDDGKVILDAGCGAAVSSMLIFGDRLNKHHFLGVDISSSIEVAKQRFKEKGLKGDFLQMSILELPVPDRSVDIIISEGVLHHTDSTERSLKYLAGKVKPGGYFIFYVYAKKAPVREFTDDLIREQLKPMSDEEAWQALQPLTSLGIALGELNTTINIKEDIPLLGIKKGEYDIQRFFYWYICKAYYRPEYEREVMNHINFDWFRPLNCHRHTPEEIKQWCDEAGLEIENITIEEAGISVVAKKR